MFLQVLCKRESIRAMTLHPDRQRFETLRQDPCIEWRHRRTGMTCKEPDLFDQIFFAKNGSPDHTALPVHELRGGVCYKVRTPIGGALQVWRGKAVVDIENKLVFLGKLSQPLEVD